MVRTSPESAADLGLQLPSPAITGRCYYAVLTFPFVFAVPVFEPADEETA
jgi:hypothetical protein